MLFWRHQYRGTGAHSGTLDKETVGFAEGAGVQSRSAESFPAADLPTGHLSDCLPRSEEHTSELQSRPHLVCRLLLEKKKKKNSITEKHPQPTTCHKPHAL